MASTIDLSVVIPAYNEGANIESCVQSADEALQALGKPYEIIVVDDGSKDETLARAQALRQRLPNVLVLHKENGGIGSAVSLGLAQARGKLFTYAPGDGQFDLHELPRLIDELGAADLLVAGKADLQSYSRSRRIASFGMRLLLRLFFGLPYRDVNFIHVYRATEYAKIRPQSRGGFFHAETVVLAQHHQLKIRETTLALKPRLSGTSHIWSLRTISCMFWEMLKLRFRLWRC